MKPKIYIVISIIGVVMICLSYVGLEWWITTHSDECLRMGMHYSPNIKQIESITFIKFPANAELLGSERGSIPDKQYTTARIRINSSDTAKFIDSLLFPKGIYSRSNMPNRIKYIIKRHGSNGSWWVIDNIKDLKIIEFDTPADIPFYIFVHEIDKENTELYLYKENWTLEITHNIIHLTEPVSHPMDQSI